MLYEYFIVNFTTINIVLSKSYHAVQCSTEVWNVLWKGRDKEMFSFTFSFNVIVVFFVDVSCT